MFSWMSELLLNWYTVVPLRTMMFVFPCRFVLALLYFTFAPKFAFDPTSPA